MRRPLRQDPEYNEYVKDFYRKIEDYDWNRVTDKRIGLESLLHKFREKRTRELINRFGTGEKYLDVGCGTGLILRHLPPGAVGIDLNPRHLGRAQQYAPRATVHLGDAENIPFPANSFSTIVCTEVIEHLVHPDQALEEISRVLIPGGVLIGSTPRRSLLWRLRFLSSTHYHNEPFHNEFTDAELKNLLKNWHIVSLQPAFLRSIHFFALRKAD